MKFNMLVWIISLSLITSIAQAVAQDEKQSQFLVHLYHALSIQHYERGEFKLALATAEAAFNIKREILGEKHHATLQNMNYLVVLYQKLAQLDKALTLSEKLYPLTKEVLGEKHPDTLLCMNNLAGAYQALGQLDKALPLSETVYRLTKEVLGDTHS
ncbi:MAG: hypothetical protein DRR19_04055 [Candidatus Parabeggiatoa sp. nov. 1]|nr:MAG: hypothetical protein DRR19_04055 [Gammaproteobacteria bacterium]